jgi:hypothetical protein
MDIQQKADRAIDLAKDVVAVGAGGGYSTAALMGWLSVFNGFIQAAIGIGTLVILYFRIRKHIQDMRAK